MADHLNSIPPFFLCPISLQVMEDPVIVATGVSYDRRSISHWLADHDKCPVTNQRLTDLTITPNDTLLHLIRSWSATANAAAAVDSFPELSEILRDLRDQSVHSVCKFRALKKIKTLLLDGTDGGCIDTVRMEKAGVTSLVASLISRPSSPMEITEDFSILINELQPRRHRGQPRWVRHQLGPPLRLPADQLQHRQHGLALPLVPRAILHQQLHHHLHHPCLHRLPPVLTPRQNLEVEEDGEERHGSPPARVLVLKNLHCSLDDIGRQPGLELLADDLENRPEEQSRADSALVRPLLQEGSEGSNKFAMVALGDCLERLRRRLEEVQRDGRLVGVSSAVTERAVAVLGLVFRNCSGGALAEELVQVGGVAKLCAVVQMEENRMIREMAKRILAMHMKEWIKSPCFPSYRLP